MKKDHRLQSYTMHQKITFSNINSRTESWTLMTLMMGSQQMVVPFCPLAKFTMGKYKKWATKKKE
jgi:hypothetical protein